VASTVAALLVSAPLNLAVISRDVGVTSFQLLRAMLGAWIWRFALFASGIGWIAAHWSPHNLTEAVLSALATGATYVLVMLPNFFRAPLGNYTRPLLDSLRVKCMALQVRVFS
jgi:hypothetical protein